MTAKCIDDGFTCTCACKTGGDRGLTKIEATEKGRLKDGIRHGVEAKASCKTRPNIKIRAYESVIVSSLDWIGMKIEGLAE